MVLAVAGCAGSDGPAAAAAGGPPAAARPSGVAGQRLSLLIHCGIRYAEFDGQTWEAVPPIPTIPTITTDTATGASRNRYVVAGTMRRVSPDQAEFVTTDDPADVHVRFQLSHAAVPGCA